MYILKSELEKAILSIPNECENVKTVLKRILCDPENTSNKVNIIDREAYLATILWTEEDISQALYQMKIEDSEENMSMIIGEYLSDEIEEAGIAAGWDVINDTIYDKFMRK